MGLHTAIEKNDLVEVKRLLLKNKQEKTEEEFYSYINYFNERNESPLLNNLQQQEENRDKITVFLLENGADPNRYYKSISASDYVAIIAPALLSGKRSEAKILLLYGAAVPKLDFSKLEGGLENFVNAVAELARKQKEIQRQAFKEQEESNFASAFLSLKEAADIWYDMSLDETNEIFKQHYQAKALDIYEKAMSCYEKIIDNEKKLSLQENYLAVSVNLIKLQYDLKALIEQDENLVDTHTSTPGITKFFTSLGQAFSKLQSLMYKQKPETPIEQPLLQNANDFTKLKMT